MPIGQNDSGIFYNADEFAEPFVIEDTGIGFNAIYNEPAGVENVLGLGIDMDKPFIEVPVDVAGMLTQGTFVLRGDRRYQVCARPVSNEGIDYMVSLVFKPV